MSRQAVASELQTLLAEIQDRAQRAERVAESSGLIDPRHFRAMQTMVSMAAGALDQLGLLDRGARPTEQVAP
jgi:hypothetical protein